MKDRLLYIIFVFFALILLSQKHTDNKQSYHEKSSIVYSMGDKNIKGIIPEFNYSLKKIEVSCFFKFVFNRIPDLTRVKCINIILSTNLKQYRNKITNFPQLKNSPYLRQIFKTSQEEDSYHLS